MHLSESAYGVVATPRAPNFSVPLEIPEVVGSVLILSKYVVPSPHQQPSVSQPAGSFSFTFPFIPAFRQSLSCSGEFSAHRV